MLAMTTQKSVMKTPIQKKSHRTPGHRDELLTFGRDLVLDGAPEGVSEHVVLLAGCCAQVGVNVSHHNLDAQGNHQRRIRDSAVWQLGDDVREIRE